MATARMKARERKRIKLSSGARYKRKELREKIKSLTTPFEEKMALVAVENKR